MFSIVLLLTMIYRASSAPKSVLALRNDRHGRMRRLLHTQCSSLNAYSPQFACSDALFYHVEFDLDVSLVPFQYQPKKCASIINYVPIPLLCEDINRSSLFMSHNNHLNVIVSKQRIVLGMHVRWEFSFFCQCLLVIRDYYDERLEEGANWASRIVMQTSCLRQQTNCCSSCVEYQLE